MAKDKTGQKFTGLSFDASSVAPQAAFEPIPSGDYNVAITDGQITATKNGKMFEFEATVLDGPFVGRKVFERLNVENTSAKAQEIAQQQLSAICHATGVLRMQDVSELFNKPFVVKIGIEAERTDKETGQVYEARNKFKGVKFAKQEGGAAPAAAATGSAQVPPKWAKPAAAAPAAPKAPAAPAKPAAPAAPKAPAAPAAKPKLTRKFYAYLPDTSMPLMSEQEIVDALAEGMPTDIKLTLEGTEDWKPISEWAIGAAPAAAPAAETAAGAAVVPPWQRNKK